MKKINFNPLIIQIFILPIIFLAFEAKAQNQANNYDPARVIGPSPTAASLGVFGEFPISYYTGSVDVSVPLYNVKTANHNLQIKLQYSSNGTRVAENASWVGLGWSLFAGGVITRTIRGMDDFRNNGYYTEQSLPPANSDNTISDGPNWAEYQNYFQAVGEGYKDAEPDIMHYNFNGYTGKFALGKSQDGSKVFVDERNNFKIQYIPQSIKWIITTPDGYQYHFGSHESAQNYNYADGYSEIDNYEPISSTKWRWDQQTDMITAWYLDEIIAASGEKLSFIYATKSSTVSLTSKSEERYDLWFVEAACGGGSGDLRALYKSYQASKQVTGDRYLVQIRHANGVIDFITSDREDIEYVGSNKPGKLSEIVVKNLNGGTIKKIVLEYGYFNEGAVFDKRLKLNKVTEYGNDNKPDKPYVFDYFNSNGLPPKYTKSIDHWGFFNGAPNSTLLPELTVENPDLYLDGGSRKPSGNIDHLRSGVLSKIIYPSSGSTQFDYELNEYSNPQGDDKYDKVPKGVSVLALPNDQTQITKSFVLTAKTNVTFSYNYLQADQNANSLEGVQTVYAYVYKQGVSGPIVSFSNWSCPTQPDPTCGSADPSDEYYQMILQPGTYTIQVRYLQGYLTTLSARWDDKVPVTQRKGGGLRIKSIINNPEVGPPVTRKFIYSENNLTTGKLITQPVYSFQNQLQQPINSCIAYNRYIGRLTNSIYSASLSAKGIMVGYSKVVELFGESAEGGKIEYYFHNHEDVLDNFPSLPPQTYTLNGKLAVKAVYSTTGIVSKTDYLYDIKSTSNLKGVKVYMPWVVRSQNPLAPTTLSAKYYDSYSNWSVLAQETETQYNGQGNIVTTKKFFYDNEEHLQPTRNEIVKSDGRKLVTKLKYPGDYPAAGTTSFVKQMKDRHMLAAIVEQQNILQEGGVDKLVGGTFTEYGLFHNSFKPKLIYRTNLSAPSANTAESNIVGDNTISFHPSYQPDVVFNGYDPSGNLLSLNKVNDVNTSFIWGFDNQYPVAKIEGLSRQEAIDKSGVNLTLLNSPVTSEADRRAELNKLRSVNGALVTTYTYNPLIGMTSQTDPAGRTTYYEYDSFGRLQLIKDQDGNIIKTFEYRYKQ